MKKKILITGGSGFIGTNCVQYFSDHEYEVLNLDIKEPQNDNHSSFWTKCDILDLELLKREVSAFSPDFCLHLAARTDLDGKSLDVYAANIEGVKNMVSALSAVENLTRVVFASSRMVCRIGYQPASELDICPPNFYGKSKTMGEAIVRSSTLSASWVIVRPTSIWGPWFHVPYRNFFTTLLNNVYFHPKGFNPKKSFGFVGNTVFQLEKIILAERELLEKKTLYLCDYPALTLLEWANEINRQFHGENVKQLPFSVLKTISVVGDILAKVGFHPPLTSFRLKNIVTEMEYNTKDLEGICEQLPESLISGVQQTVAWMKQDIQVGKKN